MRLSTTLSLFTITALTITQFSVSTLAAPKERVREKAVTEHEREKDKERINELDREHSKLQKELESAKDAKEREAIVKRQEAIAKERTATVLKVNKDAVKANQEAEAANKGAGSKVKGFESLPSAGSKTSSSKEDLPTISDLKTLTELLTSEDKKAKAEFDVIWKGISEKAELSKMTADGKDKYIRGVMNKFLNEYQAHKEGAQGKAAVESGAKAKAGSHDANGLAKRAGADGFKEGEIRNPQEVLTNIMKLTLAHGTKEMIDNLTVKPEDGSEVIAGLSNLLSWYKAAKEEAMKTAKSEAEAHRKAAEAVRKYLAGKGEIPGAKKLANPLTEEELKTLCKTCPGAPACAIK